MSVCKRKEKSRRKNCRKVLVPSPNCPKRLDIRAWNTIVTLGNRERELSFRTERAKAPAKVARLKERGENLLAMVVKEVLTNRCDVVQSTS
jgi:hypothetical protein